MTNGRSSRSPSATWSDRPYGFTNPKSSTRSRPAAASFRPDRAKRSCSRSSGKSGRGGSEYAERRGCQVTREYLDEGFSGSRERRPALDRLMADAKRRAFDAVVVFRFDRFARSVWHLARALDEFRALGIEFVSLHEAIDTSTPMGRAMFHIAGAFAELEREIIREPVRAGIQNARRRGRKLGRRRALVNPAQEVFRMGSQGFSGR